MKVLQLAGKKIGRLTVIKRAGSKVYYTKDGKRSRCVFSVWLCLCSCGKKKKVTSRSLMSGHSVSCGCKRKEPKYPEGVVFGRIFRGYRQNAKRRGVEFTLTDREFAKLISSPCYYTGRAPYRKVKFRGRVFAYNGIDRLDSSKGYNKENCVPCCYELNHAKSDLPYEDFMKLVEETYKHRIEGENERI